MFVLCRQPYKGIKKRALINKVLIMSKTVK
jgi:hypothetical protein